MPTQPIQTKFLIWLWGGKEKEKRHILYHQRPKKQISIGYSLGMQETSSCINNGKPFFDVKLIEKEANGHQPSNASNACWNNSIGVNLVIKGKSQIFNKMKLFIQS